MARMEVQQFKGLPGRMIRAFGVGVASAIVVNMLLALVLAATKLVSNPYDLTGILIGIAIMIPVGTAAALSRMAGTVALMTSMLFGVAYGAIAWNADRFIEVLPLTTCAFILPGLCALLSGWSANSLDPRPLPPPNEDPLLAPL